MAPTRTGRDIPDDYPARIRRLRERLNLTQVKLAKMMGVSFASVNRWENGQSRPSALAWQQLLRAESEGVEALGREFVSPLTDSRQNLLYGEAPTGFITDFTAPPDAVRAVAEAERLEAGHLFNPAYAIETSLIHPLPHQRLAVYHHMLPQPRLRFLLADDPGAGKTIQTGLYIREMMARGPLRRVLIVSPAGLLGNWEREMRTLFGLSFRIATGAQARAGNPFVGPDSDLMIVSIDTLTGERMFSRLRERDVQPYDLAVFDEAHKLSAYEGEEPTDRYRAAEALAGATPVPERWQLSWSSRHLLLLTATPHMGKPYPYYSLWRLLEPEILSTEYAFRGLSGEIGSSHFLRRTKEEMVDYEGAPLYPQRTSDTFSYDLTAEEQELYDLTTDYIENAYGRATTLNRSAVRLAVSVFQRRLASSTYALLCSFEKRLDKLDRLIERVRTTNMSLPPQMISARDLEYLRGELEDKTADEESPEGDQEEREAAEERALELISAKTIQDLEQERTEVLSLLERARQVYALGRESKFERLRTLLEDERFKNEKFIIFTEYRDTLEFLARRLSGLGFAGQIATIHGAMKYQERDSEIERFRKRAPDDAGGERSLQFDVDDAAAYLIATDAAGEGVNLQFAWLMVNYDVPWNPARLEQRMGRIHRYGQRRDRVFIFNVVAGKTREGRVLNTLLKKMEEITEALGSDKVFDVVGRVFENVSLRDYLEQAVTEAGAARAVQAIEGTLTEAQVRALEERERVLFGDGGEVRRALPELRRNRRHEIYYRLLPGYVWRFVQQAAPLIGIGVAGDMGDDGGFTFYPIERGAMDALSPLLETYASTGRTRLTVFPFDHPRWSGDPSNWEEFIFVHPGEPLFERFRALVALRLGRKALRGAVYFDPCAVRPYLYHLARLTVKRQADAALPGMEREQVVLSRLVGLRHEADGQIGECPVESLLLLEGATSAPASGETGVCPLPPLTAEARRLLVGVREAVARAHGYAMDTVGGAYSELPQQVLRADLPEREDMVRRGYAYQESELANRRVKLAQKATSDPRAKGELTRIKEQQRVLEKERDLAVARLRREPELIRASDVEFLAHALVLPSDDQAGRMRRDARIEAEAMRQALAYEQARGAVVLDVSTAERARAVGLSDYPGFDLLSIEGGHEPALDADQLPADARCIEVKGRADSGEVLLTENEWGRACNLRERYWLYVVYDCATAHPRLLPVQDPFRLLVRARGVVISGQEIIREAQRKDRPAGT